MSTSPEPLIDFTDEDNSSSNTKRRPPPPPPPHKSTKPMIRSKTAGDVSAYAKKPILPPHRKPLPSLPSNQITSETSLASKRPPPPPKPKALGRTVSLEITSQINKEKEVSTSTRGINKPLPLAPPNRPIPEKLQRNSSYIPSKSPSPVENLTVIKQTTPTSDDELQNEELLVDLTPPSDHGGLDQDTSLVTIAMDTPPPSSEEGSQKTNSPLSSATTVRSSSTRRVQPICLPKPISRELVYEEKEHPRNTFKRLNILREKEELCDVVLVVDEAEIKAHKIVLAACSPYFESMFIGEFAEPDGEPIIIEEIEEVALIALVDFAYTSRIKLSQTNVYTLFEAADILQFQGVKNACFRFFKSQMNKTNCIRTWLFAESHNCTELIEASLKFIEVNFLDIVRGREFLAVEASTVCRIMELEDLAIACEEQVYEAVLGWLNHDVEERQQYASKILQNVRFPSMNRDYLMHISDHEAIIRDDPDCLQLIISAIESHMSNVRGTLKKKMKKQDKQLPRTASMAVEEVELYKAGCSLGVGIMGGYDRPNHVFRQGDKPGIFIRDVMSGGAAAKSGKLRIGDRILSINGEDISRCTHEMAIRLLLTSKDPLILLIRHEPPPHGLKELTLVTKPGEGFGFSIAGGVNGDPANPLDDTDEGIFISQIIPGGAAEQDGRLTVGTRILQINSISLLGKTHEEALKVLQGVVDRITLFVCHGYNPSTTPIPSETGSICSWGEGMDEWPDD